MLRIQCIRTIPERSRLFLKLSEEPPEINVINVNVRVIFSNSELSTPYTDPYFKTRKRMGKAVARKSKLTLARECMKNHK